MKDRLYLVLVQDQSALFRALYWSALYVCNLISKSTQLAQKTRGETRLNSCFCSDCVFCCASQGAREAYGKAYRMSVTVSGADTQPTLDIKALMDNVPTSADELRARYNSDNK